MLTQSFMTIAELRHKVPKISKRVFKVFVLNTPLRGSREGVSVRSV